MQRISKSLEEAVNFSVPVTEKGDLFWSRLDFAGASFHVDIVLVQEDDDGVETPPDASESAKEKFDQFQEFHSGNCNTIEIAGRPGKYVLMVYPFSE